MDGRGIAREGEKNQGFCGKSAAGAPGRVPVRGSRTSRPLPPLPVGEVSRAPASNGGGNPRRSCLCCDYLSAGGAVLDEWISTMDIHSKRELIHRLRENSTIIAAAEANAPHPLAQDDALGTALLIEYGAAVGVCPLELHWLLGDVVNGLGRAVLAIRVEEMLLDAADVRRPGPHSTTYPARSAFERSLCPHRERAHGTIRRHPARPRRVRSARSGAWFNTITR